MPKKAMTKVMTVTQCARLNGGSIVDCECFGEVGFAECPQVARHPRPNRSASAEAMHKAAGHVKGRPPRLSGDFCGNCGSDRMVRTGTCLTCQNCGSTSGGCS